MSKTILPSLCLASILSLSLSASAWSQSAVPSPPLSPAAIEVQQEIKIVAADVNALDQRSHQVEEIRKGITKELESFIQWEAEAGVSAESFPEIVKSLQSERVDLVIDLAGLTAKRTAILSAQKAVEGIPDQFATDKTLLANSLLETSLELAEKKARLESIKSLLVDLLPARKKLESLDALKMRSKRALERQIEVNDEHLQSSLRLEILSKKLTELKKELKELKKN